MASRCKLNTPILYAFPRYEIVIILKREKTYLYYYPTTVWSRRTPCSVTQADGMTKPLQLKPRVTTKSDACTRVMKQTLCRSVGGHRRPAAAHHWREIQTCGVYLYTHKVSLFRTKCPVIKITTHRRHLKHTSTISWDPTNSFSKFFLFLSIYRSDR